MTCNCKTGDDHCATRAALLANTNGALDIGSPRLAFDYRVVPRIGDRIAAFLAWLGLKKRDCGCAGRQAWLNRHDAAIRLSVYFGVAVALAAMVGR